MPPPCPFLTPLLCGLATLPLLLGCPVRGKGPLMTEKRPLKDVTAILLANQGNLDIQQGTEEALTITCESNLLRHIQTDIQDGTLTIKTQKDVALSSTHPIRYQLTVKSLNAIKQLEVAGSGDIHMARSTTAKCILKVHGSGDIHLEDLTAHALEVSVMGSGDIHVAKLRAAQLNASLVGSGNLSIDGGTLRQQTVSLEGSSDYDASNLTSPCATITLNGSGDASVYATDTLTAHVNGSGNIHYRGTPKVQSNITGAGTVEQL